MQSLIASPKSHHPAGVRPSSSENVLVGVDGAVGGRDAIALAKSLQLHEPDGTLMLAHVAVSQAPTFRNFHSTPAWRASRDMLEREGELAGVRARFAGTAGRSVASGLHQLVEDCGAGLLVVGTCSRGPLGRLFRGDDTRGALRSPPCPVAVAPPNYAEMLEASPPADLLVLDASRQGRFRRLFFARGVARLARSARCPLLVLPSHRARS